MSRKTKLIILLCLSLSVFFIYKITVATTYNLLTLGDGLSQGINSYGIKDYGYVDYYKDYLLQETKQVNIIDKYSEKDLSIKYLLEKIEWDSSLKRDLLEAHLLIINAGYNDLLYQLSILDKENISRLNSIINNIGNDYYNLIENIRKYYKNDIIVVGYYASNKADYYLNYGIKQLNYILSSNNDIIYIDTYNLLKNRSKYFSNPNSYYPNKSGYSMIANKIIVKTLEK